MKKTSIIFSVQSIKNTKKLSYR